jgi:hypothetical protein
MKVRIHGAIFVLQLVSLPMARVTTQVAKAFYGATLTQVAAIVAKSRSEFYFRQRLLQLVSQKHQIAR